MYINIMRFRTGKFGVSATETTKNGKVINKPDELKDMKREFGERCTEYRIDRKDGVQHHWTFENIGNVAFCLNNLPFPSQDNDEISE